MELDYKVHLEAFEGPLDLLLHLIRKEDLNIYDIPIAKVLGEYLDYLNLSKELDVDLAGEFVEMASELAYIKSRMLLPEPEGEVEEIDPRADLVQRLLEYGRYKAAAQSLLARPLLGVEVFTRPASKEEEEEVSIEADLASLVSAFQDLLKRLPDSHVHEVRQPRMGVAERVMELTERLKGKDRVPFETLFEGEASRIDLVVTFLAILEMAKQRLLRIIQGGILGKIYVSPLFSEAMEEAEEAPKGAGAINGT